MPHVARVPHRTSGIAGGMKMKEQVAIVTGGGTGIGRATVLALVERGARVLFTYSRSEREAAQTAADEEDMFLSRGSDDASSSDDDDEFSNVGAEFDNNPAPGKE